MSAAGPAARACRGASAGYAGSTPNLRRAGRHWLARRSVPSPGFEANHPAKRPDRHGGGAFACGPDVRPHLPWGAQAARHCRRAHAKRVERRCGFAHHACPCDAWTSCRPCALPPTPRQIAASRRLRGLPRCFSTAPRKSLGYAAGARLIFALPQEYQRLAKSPNSFLGEGFAEEFHASAERRIFFKTGICNRRAFVYKRRTPAEPPAGLHLLGNSSMVEQRTLTPSILVRIQVPQPISSKLPCPPDGCNAANAIRRSF